jgi:DNA-binding transcriptional ArsR family regulator
MGTGDESHIDQRLVKGLAHPLRVRILMTLAGGTASPSEIADDLGERLGNVSYHMRVLAELECIDLIETRPVRGATEHYYKVRSEAFIGSAPWQKLPAQILGHAATESLRSFIAKAVEAIEHETFEKREGSRITWFPQPVDQEGWDEVVSILANAEKLLKRAVQRSAQRLNGGEPIPILVALAAFESGASRR